MSYADATKRPAQGFEVSEEVVDLLQAVSTLTAALGSASYIYEHRAPEPIGGQWKRCIVRTPIRGEGSRINVNRTKGFRFDVMFEVQEQVEKPDQFLAQAHDLAYQALIGQSLTLTRGTPLGTIQPYSEATAAAFDADDHSFYSTAGYIVALTSA